MELVALEDGVVQKMGLEKTEGKMMSRNYSAEQKNALLVMCKLVAYILSTIMKTDEEWMDWGYPFLLVAFDAQFGEEEGKLLADSYNQHFYPIIRERTALIVEDELATSMSGESNSDKGYTFVFFAENKLLVDLQQIASDTREVDLQSALTTFLDNYFNFVLSSRNYDARARLVAQRVCLLLNMAAHDFSDLEQNALSHANTMNKEGTSFPKAFADIAGQIPKSSVATPYRMLKIALVAVGGGAMVGMSSIVAAPTIITTIIPLLTAASEIFQVSVTFNMFLSSLGMIPYLFGTYGGSYATYVMLQRTASLANFQLSPLYNPHVEAINAQTSTVCIVIAGHKEKGTEQRGVWGADGTSLVADLEQELDGQYAIITTLAKQGKEIAEMIVHKAAELGHPLLGEVVEHEVGLMEETLLKPPSPSNKPHAQSDQVAEQGIVTENGEELVEENVEQDWESIRVTCKKGWFRDVLATSEAYVLTWDCELLDKLQGNFTNMISQEIYSKVYGKLKSTMLAFTPLPSIQRAFSLPMMIIKKLEMLNDPWIVAMDRARQAGYLLAKTLLRQKKSEKGGVFRPVNLVGYGMAARVVFHCLELLYEEGGKEAYGMVENAVLLGAPVSASSKIWPAARLIVTRRLVNCYSTNDWILALLYRSKSLELNVAGISPVYLPGENTSAEQKLHFHIHEDCEVESTDGNASAVSTDLVIQEEYFASPDGLRSVENIDVSKLIKNHSDYPKVLNDILQIVQL